MIVFSIGLGILIVLSVIATIRVTRSDGLRPVPTRRIDTISSEARRDAYDLAT